MAHQHLHIVVAAIVFLLAFLQIFTHGEDAAGNSTTTAPQLSNQTGKGEGGGGGNLNSTEVGVFAVAATGTNTTGNQTTTTEQQQAQHEEMAFIAAVGIATCENATTTTNATTEVVLVDAIEGNVTLHDIIAKNGTNTTEVLLVETAEWNVTFQAEAANNQTVVEKREEHNSESEFIQQLSVAQIIQQLEAVEEKVANSSLAAKEEAATEWAKHQGGDVQAKVDALIAAKEKDIAEIEAKAREQIAGTESQSAKAWGPQMLDLLVNKTLNSEEKMAQLSALVAQIPEETRQALHVSVNGTDELNRMLKAVDSLNIGGTNN